MTVYVEVIDNRAFNLLSDMEYLDLIRVDIPTDTAFSPNVKFPGHLAGALKLTDEKYEYFQRTLKEGRNEWDRNIY